MCRATGKYLAFLDADDAWSPHKIERQWQAMEQQNLDLLGGHSAVLRIEQAIPHETTSKILRITPVRLLPAMLSNPFHTSSVMMRRDTSMHFPQTGQLSEDYALWLARIAADWRCAHHPEALSFMFKQAYGDTGLSASLWRMQRGELIALLSLGWMTHPLLLALAIPFSCLKFGQRVLRTCSRSLVTRMGSPSG
jgi:glycosyltransferase involved in cell wall biosynthesis